MKLASTFRTLFVVAALAVASVASAQVEVTPITGENTTATFKTLRAPAIATPNVANAISIIYDNTASAANTGISSTDLAAYWGDECITTGVGVLSTQKFTVFNSSTNAGTLSSVSVQLDYYDAITAAYFGSFAGTVSFASPLTSGQFSTITATALDGFAINLTSSDLIVLQHVTSFTGTTNKLGVVSRSPVTIGSSPLSMYIQASTVGGGVGGFYTSGSTPLQTAYQIGVNALPVGTKNTTWGRLKQLYH